MANRNRATETTIYSIHLSVHSVPVKCSITVVSGSASQPEVNIFINIVYILNSIPPPPLSLSKRDKYNERQHSTTISTESIHNLNSKSHTKCNKHVLFFSTDFYCNLVSKFTGKRTSFSSKTSAKQEWVHPTVPIPTSDAGFPCKCIGELKQGVVESVLCYRWKYDDEGPFLQDCAHSLWFL